MSAERESHLQKTITDKDVEEQILAFFDRNYDLLKQEGGHVLAESTKKQALQQVLCYWQKLRDIATTVTETEVKLSLPGQVTPKGRRFVIEGVVDIVREDERVLMYDLKTHEAEDVWAEAELYEAQLNVYAHIWKGIRGEPLDGTAVIATRLPLEVTEAIRSGDPVAIAAALADWNPVVDLDFDERKIQQTIKDFGRCVDAIEEGDFKPPPLEKLRKVRRIRKHKGRAAGNNQRMELGRTFAQFHCQSCDARFSCSSYRAYDKQEGGRQRKGALPVVQDEATARELDAWIEENLAEV